MDTIRILIQLQSIASNMDTRGEQSETTIFRASNETLSDGYLSLNTEFEVLSYNPQAREQFDLKGVNIIGESLWELCPNYVDTAAFQTLETALTTRTQQSFESYSPELEQWVKIRVYPTDDGLTLLSSDRSGSFDKHEQDLFFDNNGNIGVGGWRIDLPSNSLQVSEEVKMIRGLPPDYDLCVEDGIEFYHPEDRPIIQAAIDRLRAEGESYDLELRELTDDGEVYWVRTTGVPEYDADGDLTAMRGVYRDITGRKRQELELKQTQSQVKSERDGKEAIQRLLLQTATDSEIADSFCRLLVTTYNHDAAWVVRSQSWESRDTEGVVWVAGYDDIGGLAGKLQSGALPIDEATQRALDTNKIVTITAETADETAAVAWLAAQGLRSVRSVPLTHDGVSYGVLTVGQRGVDNEVPQRLVDEAAAALAFKKQVHRQRDALITDSLVECKMRIPADHFLGRLSEAPAMPSDATVHAYELHQDANRGVTYLLKTADIDGEQLAAVAQSTDGVHEARLLSTSSMPVVRIQVEGPTVGTLFQQFGGVLQSLTAQSGIVDLSVEFPRRTHIRDIVGVIRENWPTVSVRSRIERSGSSDRVATFDILTQKQEEALRAATVAGFFERPQNATAHDVAEILGVSNSTVLQHLRAAEQKIFADAFDSSSPGK